MSLTVASTCGSTTYGQDSKAEADAITAYRRETLAANGDQARGRRLVLDDSARTRCLLCHAVDGRGGRLGPDLLGVGGRYGRADLLDAILYPSRTIHPDYAANVIVTRDGRTVQGIVRPAGPGELDVATSATESTRIALDTIDEQKPSPVSFMPTGLHLALTPREMADMLAYLSRLELPGSMASNEAGDPADIPRARRPVRFVPVHGPDIAFKRPVWTGAVPGSPGRSLVVEIQTGAIWLLDRTSNPPTRSLFGNLASETTGGEITGVTSLAFHPDYAHNRRYFVKLHGPRDRGRIPVLIVERKATDDGLRDSGTPSKLILTIPTASEIHNGGHLLFGPDGYLYIGMGDTGPQGDPRGHAQDLSLLLGKMLRIDVDHTEGDRPYAIPPTNPFRDRPGARPEVWAYGFREPWRFSFDTASGDLWVGDVGQGRYEEVSTVRSGENHGWNVLEGLRPHSEAHRVDGANYVPPRYAYSHRVGVSVTGGFVYHGKAQPALEGRYIFADYETRRVWALDSGPGPGPGGFKSIVEIGRAPERVVSFAVDDDGEILMLGFDRGTLYRLDPAGLDLAAVVVKPLVPTSRQTPATYRYVIKLPPDDWMAPGFDDSSWTSAPGGFGPTGMREAPARTDWRSPDIWVRREFEIPPGTDPARLSLTAFHDEDAEFYLNGILAARATGYVNSYVDLPISAEARATIHPGRNTLAVHCHQTRGGQYIDVGINQEVDAPSPVDPKKMP